MRIPTIITIIICILMIMFAGCSTTVPVVAKFPNVPENLMQKCPQLKTIDTDKPSIIDVTKTVTENYTTYHECEVKIEGWIEWYQLQKNIFEEISK